MLAIRFGLYAALFNAALAGALGAWFYRFAESVPLGQSYGALADTWISAFVIPFVAWFFVAPGVERAVRAGELPPRPAPAASALGRFVRLPALVRALAFGVAGLVALGLPLSLLLRLLAPDPLTLAGFLACKALIAGVVAGAVIPAIAFTSLTLPDGMLKAVPRFPVLDMAAALEFYEKRMGFTRLFDYGDYAGVARSGFELHFFLMADPRLPKWTACRANVVGVDALYAEYLAAGVVHPNGPLMNQPWGFREFTALDLYGNAIVFGELRWPT
jgi:catechol 2,3-dioxygenase-like lactoylglutathione lyase family enzyme